jgi:hypothetical protein
LAGLFRLKLTTSPRRDVGSRSVARPDV